MDAKYIPIMASISFKLIQEPILFCDHNPRDLVLSFIGALETLPKQSEGQLKMHFLQIEIVIEK